MRTCTKCQRDIGSWEIPYRHGEELLCLQCEEERKATEEPWEDDGDAA